MMTANDCPANTFSNGRRALPTGDSPFACQLAYERVLFRSIRRTLISLVVVFAVICLGAAVRLALMISLPPPDLRPLISDLPFTAVSLGLLMIWVMATLSTSKEIESGAIHLSRSLSTSVFRMTSARALVYVAAYGVLIFAATVVTMVATWSALQAFGIASIPPDAVSVAAQYLALGITVAGVVLLGEGIAFSLRATWASIAVFVLIAFVLPVVLITLGLGGIEFAVVASNALPTVLIDSVVAAPQDASGSMEESGRKIVSAFGVLAYGLVAFALGNVREMKS